ncbi:MAG: hypothetical protein Q4A78_02490 [Peptostreptococcaceae bacterium]|nr:hypothetical protein [Peptostreptococcaceae bacterium]
MLNFKMLSISSILWSLLWIFIVYVSVQRFPWTIEHDYPPDVREAAKITPPDEKGKKQALIFMIFSFIAVASSAIGSVFLSYDAANLSSRTVFFHLLILCMTWNIVDLVVLDWIFICFLNSKWFIFPGTEHCKGNKDYKFHFAGFLKGCVAMTVVAGILTGFCLLLFRLM